MTEVYDFVQSISQDAIVSPSSFRSVSKLHRAYALTMSLFNSADGETNLKDSLTADQSKNMIEKMQVLHQVVYPWAFVNSFTSLPSLMDSFKHPKGIVLCFGDNSFENGLLMIHHIRKNLNCNLPIEVFYNGIRDLSAAKSLALNTLKGVTARNLQDVFPGRNYHIKPFAVLAASFKEVVYVDNDIILFQSPDEIASSSKIFKKYGTLFFKGPSFELGNSRWARWFIKHPSSAANTTGRFFTNLSKDEMDASLMLFDKARLKVVLGLLTTCHLNLREVREAGLDKHFQGDKETYWLSLELLRVPYKFAPVFAGVAGHLQEKAEKVMPNSVCGLRSHLDEVGKLLYVNSGSARFYNGLDKWEKTLSHYIAPASGDQWKMDSTVQQWCISGSVPEVFLVSTQEKDLVRKYRQSQIDMP
ncbi:mannosyltransferase putative-domain-containing protein [Chytriomyces cf. hyalinus JEL632]|nr:mannosyltransferase putative-domain-containing protein [Chytriomyces cf. hyalinus JEL632]